MAYNLTNNSFKDINYFGKDFSSLKNNLIKFSKTYYPYTNSDFSDASPGMMFIDMAAYVGDMLSFYMDIQLQESFLQHAQEKKNIVDLAQMFGYTPHNTYASSTTLDVNLILPAIITTDQHPDFDFGFVIEEGSLVQSTSGVIFRLLDDVDFTYTSSVAEVSTHQMIDNKISYFLISKNNIRVSSAEVTEETFTFTTAVPNASIKLSKLDCLDIISCIDGDDNIWYEVPHLAKDTVVESIRNDSFISNNALLQEYKNEVPYLMNLKRVSKKFIRRLDSEGNTILMFGSGIGGSNDETVIINQENINSGFDTVTVDNRNIDPSNFLYLGSNGETPSNTTLTVKYYFGGGIKSNVESHTITTQHSLKKKFKKSYDILNDKLNGDVKLKNVENSLYFTNIYPAIGGRDEETDDEIRENASLFFQSQNRCVTSQDYIVRALSLPQKFGVISKAYVSKDTQIVMDTISGASTTKLNPLALNLHCLTYVKSGVGNYKNLSYINYALKTNLQKYLDMYRMVTDSINIVSAFIINFSVKFDIVVIPGYNQNEVLAKSIIELQKFFHIDNMQINKPILESDMMMCLASVPGVQNVKEITLTNEFDGTYSSIKYDMSKLTQPTSTTCYRNGIYYPAKDPSIFEIKYPDTDIKGKVSYY